MGIASFYAKCVFDIDNAAVTAPPFRACNHPVGGGINGGSAICSKIRAIVHLPPARTEAAGVTMGRFHRHIKGRFFSCNTIDIEFVELSQNVIGPVNGGINCVESIGGIGDRGEGATLSRITAPHLLEQAVSIQPSVAKHFVEWLHRNAHRLFQLTKNSVAFFFEKLNFQFQIGHFFMCLEGAPAGVIAFHSHVFQRIGDVIHCAGHGF